jgi:hypothetical protein
MLSVRIRQRVLPLLNGEHIKDFGVDYKIYKNGTVDVVETIIYDFTVNAATANTVSTAT